MLQLKLLGVLSLQRHNAPVPPAAQQKRRLALLALLAVGDERGISRDRLQSYLWPESAGPRARHALDQLIYATRRSLGADPILSGSRELRLNPAVIETDIRLFSDAIREKRFTDAAEVYGGQLLLGFHIGDSRDMENWIETERTRLDIEYHFAIESLARDSADRGDLRAAINSWLRLSASDRHSSRIAIETVRCFIAAGDTAGAILHARNYQQFVRTELDVEPDPVIEKLVSGLPRPHVTERPTLPSPTLVNPDSSNSVRTPPGVTVPPTDRWFSMRRDRIVPAAIGLFLVVAALFAVLRARDHGILRSTVAAPSKPEHVSPEARADYLRALNAWNDRSKSALDTAVVYFRKAADSAPDYAEAHAGLANAYVMIGYSGYRAADAMFPKAKAAALRAIALDSTIGQPWAALGMELTWERRFREAEVAYRKAIALDPDYATAHQWYGILLMIVGRTPEAVAETRRAAELDPLSLQIQNNYATFLASSGQPEAALRHYEKVVGEEPDSAWVRRNPWLLTNMAGVYASNHQLDRALRYARRAVEILPGHPRAANALARVYYRMGKPELARAVLAGADKSNEHYAAYRGMDYAAIGQPDSAFAWFNRAGEWGIPILISLPGLRKNPAVSGDPRLKLLFERLGIPFVPAGSQGASSQSSPELQ